MPIRCVAVRQVTDFFTLDDAAAGQATVEMKNLLLINQCAVLYTPGERLVGWLVGWLVGTCQVMAGWLRGLSGMLCLCLCVGAGDMVA